MAAPPPDGTPHAASSPAAPSLEDGLLLECVVTSTNEDGSTNVAPMGPIVDPTFTWALLRPFAGSTTLSNLQRDRRGVLNVTDDVELIAHSALNQLDEPPPLIETPSGAALAAGCRWYALEAASLDTSRERSEIVCQVVGTARLRDFVGFNRAKHAVIEATILATRLDYLPPVDVLQQVDRLAPPVDKTGGPAERRAFAFVRDYIARHPAIEG